MCGSFFVPSVETGLLVHALVALQHLIVFLLVDEPGLEIAVELGCPALHAVGIPVVHLAVLAVVVL